MPDVRDLEAEAIASTFRPNWRKIGLGVLLNVVILALLLGVPYVRGRTIALNERAAFGRVAACLFGGEPSATPGLSLPSGERDRFAANVLFAPSDWPLRCRSPLRQIAPPNAIFLWPSVKQAGVDVRAVVNLLDQELVALHRARSTGSGRVPGRPLAAFAKLQAGLTLMAKATDLESDIDDAAVRFIKPLTIAAPARLPLMAAEGATVDIVSIAGTLEAIALDGRGVSFLRVDSGKIDHERIKRTSSMRASVRAGNEPYLVWATPESRCKEREDHCAQRATGVAAYDKGAGAAPTPVWLAAHPAGRVDRVVRISPDHRLDMLALSQGGTGLELRRFRIDAQPTLAAEPAVTPAVAAPTASAAPAPGAPTVAAAPAAEAIRPLSSFVSIPIGETQAAPVSAWLADDSSYAAYATQSDAAIHTTVVSITADVPQALALPTVPGTAPWLLACSTASSRWFAYGSSDALRLVQVARVTDLSHVIESAARNVRITTPLHPENPALDRVRLSCSDAGAQLFMLDAQAVLSSIRCTAQGACAAPRRVAAGVAAFAAVTTEDGVLLAYSGIMDREQKVLRMSPHDQPDEVAHVHAACWEPSAGMCGVPLLINDGHRIVLTAREGSDLLAIETSDGGRHFETLSDVQVGRALDMNSHDPLQQHRVRKGIE